MSNHSECQCDSTYVELLEIATNLSKKERTALVHWFNRENIEFQSYIFDEQKNQFFKLVNQRVDERIIPLAAFYLAINKAYKKVQIPKSKNKNQKLAELESVSKVELIRFKKEKYSPVLQMLLSMDSKIKELYYKGFTLRSIQKILSTKHRKSVSHTYLSQYINRYIKKGSSGE